METAGSVRVFEVDPDLGAGLSQEELAQAGRHAVAPVIRLEAGPWRPRDELEAPDGCFGLLVVDGMLTRDVELAGTRCVELLGGGDVLRPWDQDEDYGSIPFEVGWKVIEPARLAILDRRLAAVAARWPAVTNALVARAIQRSHSLAFHLAVNCLTRVDERLLLLMWHLADRWGAVSRDGVVLRLRLTHQALASLVGAQRPSVTTALSKLAEAELVQRRADGSWLLTGEPPKDLKAMYERRARRESLAA